MNGIIRILKMRVNQSVEPHNSMSLASLSVELIENILRYLEPWDLHQCCLASRWLNLFAQRCLYRHVILETPRAVLLFARRLKRGGGNVQSVDKNMAKPITTRQLSISLTKFQRPCWAESIDSILVSLNQLDTIKIESRIAMTSVSDVLMKSILQYHRFSLKHIHLSNCPFITDLGVRHLSRCRNLETVVLIGCPLITDIGMETLQQCLSLKQLKVVECWNVRNSGG